MSRAWQTGVFTTLTFCQVMLSMCLRKNKRSFFVTSWLSNKVLVLAAFATLGLQLLLIYTPLMNKVFKTVPLTFHQLGICFGASLFMIAITEVYKKVIRV